jgi:hypothetical protein
VNGPGRDDCCTVENTVDEGFSTGGSRRYPVRMQSCMTCGIKAPMCYFINNNEGGCGQCEAYSHGCTLREYRTEPFITEPLSEPLDETYGGRTAWFDDFKGGEKI